MGKPTTRRWMMAVLMLAGCAAWAQQGNLLRNAGFEEPVTSAGVPAWGTATHGQDFARCEVNAQSYHSGLKAAAIEIQAPPRVYACWVQTVRVEREEDLPDEISLWYSAPEAGFVALVSFAAFENGQRIDRGVVEVPLAKSGDWHPVVKTLAPAPDVREIRVEVRASVQGRFLFDDVVLTRRNVLVRGKPDRLLLVGAVGRSRQPDAKLAPLWEDALTNAGWSTYEIVDWDALTPSLLRRARVVVIAAPPRRLDATARDEAIVDLLTDYVKAGGGLMLGQTTTQMTLLEMTLTDLLARRFGTRLLVENVKFDPQGVHTIGAWGDTVVFTDQVSGPVAEGVGEVCLPAAFAFLVQHSVLPFLPETPWQVVLRAGPGVRTIPRQVGLDDFDREVRPAGFDRDVPLAGIREYGRGRVAFVGIMGPQLFNRGYSGWDREVFETYMTKGIGGRPSGLLKFMLNMFGWLSANADLLETATLTKRDTAADEGTTTWKMFRGVVGPRTCYSTGTSTPDEYVAKAREMGLDYLIFLEDFAALKPSGFMNLKEDCRRLTDQDFLAISGFSYLNTDGNHQYVYGPHLRLPSDLATDRTGKRMRVYLDWKGAASYLEIHWLYSLLGFENNGGWFNFSRNPYPNYDVRDLANMGVLTQEGGKTVDREVDGYGLNNRNGQMLLPQAIALLDRAEELDGCTNGTIFLNVIGAEGRRQLDPYLTGFAGRGASHLYPAQPPYGNTFITSGPEIALVMPRADIDAQGNLYNPNLQEWPLSLTVTSSVGLKEVFVMDGTRMIRRFLPGGETNFVFTGNIGKERQKYIWARATDTRGGEAIGRAINCNSWILRESQCADRNNQLLDSRQLRPDGTPFFVGYVGTTATPDKGPWNGRCFPVGCFIFDEKLGVPPSIYDGGPEDAPRVRWAPWVAYDGQIPTSVGWLNHLVAGKEGAPHVKPYRVVASSDVLVGDRVLDGVFPLNTNPVIHVWHSVYPVTPSTYLKTTGRTSLYLIKPDGISAYLWEQDLEFLKDIPVPTNKPGLVSLGGFSAGTGTEGLYARQGEPAEVTPVKAVPLRTLPFDAGDYAGFVKSPFGSLAVYSLTDGLTLGSDGVNVSVRINATGGVVKAGTRYRVRLLSVGMHREVADPVALAAAIRYQYGLGVPATGYTVLADQGSVVEQSYVLTLAASEGACFRGTIKGVKSMAGNLGCQVTGLNDRWTAVFQWQGKTPKQRLIPVEEGIGYAVVRDADDGVPLFIGHPITADNAEVVLQLSLSKDWKRWELEIHNPTDEVVTTTVCSAPGLNGFVFNECVTLPSGSSAFRILGEVPPQ
ncbi:MAG: hypothetical protein PHR35_01925 [Kiritimatiellae bacterium]|nr:hypothetical protein [Kiritimatiellia bacterium]